MERITSRQNPLLSHIERLSSDAAYRTRRGEYVCEGKKLLDEALAAGVEVTAAVFHEELAVYADSAGIGRAVCVPDGLYSRVSVLRNAREVLFTCKMPVETAFTPTRGQVLCLDGVQDPGNVGTVLRSADAFGLDAVFLTNACADVYNPKTVRAAMGSLFRVPVYRMEPDEFLSLMHAAKLPVYAATLSEDSVSVRDISLARAAVIVGSEGKGVSEYLRRMSDARVIIPMCGRAESLNAGVAASLIAYLFTCT